MMRRCGVIDGKHHSTRDMWGHHSRCCCSSRAFAIFADFARTAVLAAAMERSESQLVHAKLAEHAKKREETRRNAKKREEQQTDGNGNRADGRGAANHRLVVQVETRPNDSVPQANQPLTPLESQNVGTLLMKTTLNVDDHFLEEARRLTNIDEKTALVRAGLEALIARESARRLAALAGSEPELVAGRRRRASARAIG